MTICRINERNTEAVEIETAATESVCVPLGLYENVLWTQAEPLRLDRRDGLPLVKQHVVCRTFCGFVLFDRRGIIPNPGCVAY